MTLALRALVLGWFAGVVVTVVVAAGIALGSSAAREPLRVEIGPLAVLAVDVRGDATEVLLGPGLLVVALGLGVVNALAALLLARRRGGGEPIA